MVNCCSVWTGTCERVGQSDSLSEITVFVCVLYLHGMHIYMYMCAHMYCMHVRQYVCYRASPTFMEEDRARPCILHDSVCVCV